MGAFVMPLAKGKVEAWKRWLGELQGPRAEEFAAFNRRMGLSAHRVWLSWGPEGTRVVVVVEGAGEDRFLERLFAESEPFAVWFREQVVDLHDLDPSKPYAERSRLCLDWADVPASV